MPVLGCDRLRMELNAFDRVLFMPHPLNNASVSPCRNLKLIGWERRQRSGQAMVTNGSHALRDPGENPPPVVCHYRLLSVHDFTCKLYLTAIYLIHGLASQAYPEDWNLASKRSDRGL